MDAKEDLFHAHAHGNPAKRQLFILPHLIIYLFSGISKLVITVKKLKRGGRKDREGNRDSKRDGSVFAHLPPSVALSRTKNQKTWHGRR